MAITNRGKFLLLEWGVRAATRPAKLYVALATGAVTPTVDINTLGQLTQITAGNGYTDGGFELTPGATDIPTSTQDNSGDKAFVRIKDIAWTASGGTLPSSGDGARWAVLTDDNATVANRQVLAYFDLNANRQIGNTEVLTLQNLTLELTEA